MLLHVFKVAILGAAYISCSAGLIAFNKYLIHEDRFPFAAPLVCFHMLFCSAFSVVLYLCCPSLFPSLTDPEKRVEIDRWLFLTGGMPIGALLAIQLIFTNTAFLHLSVAFLQMCKEANIILVYIFSVILAVEHFNWGHIGILSALLLATTLTIYGEMHFSWMGLTIQLSGQVFESLKIVLQSKLLCAAGRKLDALTYVLVVMPCCLLFAGAALCCLYIMPLQHFQVPGWTDLHAWWPYLLVNAAVAFCLNVLNALVVKCVSAMGLVFTGIIKDICIVLTSWGFLKEVITPAQGAGFTLQLTCISLWSSMKMFPEKFQGAGVTLRQALRSSANMCQERLEVAGKPSVAKLEHLGHSTQDAPGMPFAATVVHSYGSNGATGTVGEGAPGAAATVLDGTGK